MKRFKVLCTLLSLLIASSLFASEAPIRISAGKYYNQFSQEYYPQVVITSVSNSVTIKNVIVNKGNCKYDKNEYYGSSYNLRTRKIFPKKLLYGKQLKISVLRCNILRVDVETNKGSWNAEFE